MTDTPYVRPPQPPEEPDNLAASTLVWYRATAPTGFTAPRVQEIMRAARRRSLLRSGMLVAIVLAIVGVPVLLFRPSGHQLGGPNLGGGPRTSASAADRPSLPANEGRQPPGPSFPGMGERIDLTTFRTRLPTIVEPEGAATPSCPGGDVVFHSDGQNPARATLGRTTYVIGGHPTMPDHMLPNVAVDVDGDGTNEIVTTIACEPTGGRRTVNLYVLKRNGSGYDVLDVPFSDNRSFNTPRPILFNFGVTGRTLVLTLDDLGAQPEPAPSKIPDGRPENPRDVIMEWDGKAYQPRVGNYHW